MRGNLFKKKENIFMLQKLTFFCNFFFQRFKILDKLQEQEFL
jgi:hypothetical protein